MVFMIPFQGTMTQLAKETEFDHVHIWGAEHMTPAFEAWDLTDFVVEALNSHFHMGVARLF